ncbi:MAG: hypothetical protein Q9217_001851 [Psora testacea]
MPIEQLTANTIHAIGSSQSLTDSASVVKELVDNAIDAHATAIFVEVSSNALDKMQVRDNGHGIAMDDRKMLCTRYCTSKIRNLEDLQNIGGRSLGFRGEALASAVEMSGGLKLTTRVEGEETAMEYAYDPRGTTLSEKRVSHPIGTTLSVLDYLKNLPVRRQTAESEKTATLQLAKIKRLLQAYALARPYIRLSLKVFKAKTEKTSWIYAPNQSVAGAPRVAPSTMDAATKMFGKKLTDLCQWVLWSLRDKEHNIEPALSQNPHTEFMEGEGYNFEALLPKAELVDFSTLAMPRQFISVDARPVSCTRGTAKHIVSRFKRSFRSAASGSNPDKSVDPFLFLNIVCPKGSYDVNIEPAKDVVLFDNPELVVSLADNFFQDIYGKPTISATHRNSSPAAAEVRGFGLLLADATPVFATPHKGQHTPKTRPMKTVEPKASKYSESLPAAAANSTILSSTINERPQQGRHSRPVARRSMYDDNEDSEDQTTGTCNDPFPLNAEQDQDGESPINDIGISNPWAIAKFNALLRQPGRTRSNITEKDASGQIFTHRQQRGDVSTSPALSSGNFQDALDQQSQAISTPRRSGRRPSEDSDSASPSTFPFPLRARAKPKAEDVSLNRMPNDKERCGNGALDTWAQRPLNSYTDDSELERIDNGQNDRGQQRVRVNDFVSARTLPSGTALTNIPDASLKHGRKQGPGKQKSNSLKKTFVSPVNDPQQVWFEASGHGARRQQLHIHPPTNAPKTPEAEVLKLREDESGVSVASNAAARPLHPDLANTLDYEARKQMATKEYRDDERRQSLERQRAAVANNGVQTMTPPSSSPFKNRYVKAIAALQSSNNTSKATAQVAQPFKIGDPRAFLIREQAREEAENAPQHPKPRVSKRAKTAMLPLETTHEEVCVRELLLKLSVKEGDIEVGMHNLNMYDEYTVNGLIADAFQHANAKQVETWEEKLEQLVTGLYAREETSIGLLGEADVFFDLASALQEHGNHGES